LLLAAVFQRRSHFTRKINCRSVKKMAVYWFVALNRLVDCTTDLWNVGKLIPVHTALQPRRQPSPCSQPWEARIVLVFMLVRLTIWKKKINKSSLVLHGFKFGNTQ
jgi:hypothetical protein